MRSYFCVIKYHELLSLTFYVSVGKLFHILEAILVTESIPKCVKLNVEILR